MSDSSINDAFRGTAAAAEAMLTKMESEQTPVVQATTPASETVAPPVVDTPVVAAEPVAQTATPATAEPLDVSPDTPIKIKVNGEVKVVKASEYQEMLQRTDVFTQRQQAVAKQQRELEQTYAQKEAYLMQQAQAIQAYADQVARAQHAAPQQAQPQINPQEIATIGELQQALTALASQFQQVRQQDQQAYEQRLAQTSEHARQEFEIAQDQKRFTNAVQQVLDSDDGKLLAELNPKAEAILRFETLQQQPQNTDEAIQRLNEYAREWAGRVKGRLTHQQTAAAVTAARTVMEAPVGQAPPIQQAPQKIALKKDGSVDWSALRARAESIIQDM